MGWDRAGRQGRAGRGGQADRFASIYRIVILNKSCFSKEQCRFVAGRQAGALAGVESGAG